MRPNLREFGTIAGLVLDQLVTTHPVREDVEPALIMAQMGLDNGADVRPDPPPARMGTAA